MSENEVWNDVVGYEGLYKVSNKGDIYSVDRRDSLGRKQGGLTLRPGYDKDGYPQVALCKDGKVKTKKIHRLVTEAFTPNPNGFPEVNHKDENKANNYVENLEWCTRKYNVNFGTAVERATQTQSKKVKAINIKTGEVLTFNSISEAIRKGYSGGHVSAACRGVYNKGGGNLYRNHHWYYQEENK